MPNANSEANTSEDTVSPICRGGVRITDEFQRPEPRFASSSSTPRAGFQALIRRRKSSMLFT